MRTGHLQLFGRKKNMIVTEEGKNIYPEDIETVFESLPVKEFCVFAANYIWPQRSMVGEQLAARAASRARPRPYTEELRRDISARNNRLLNYKRIHGIVLFDEDFPRTASLKIKRNVLGGAAREARSRDRGSAALIATQARSCRETECIAEEPFLRHRQSRRGWRPLGQAGRAGACSPARTRACRST